MDMLTLLRTGQSSSNLIRTISSLYLAMAEKVETSSGFLLSSIKFTRG